MAKAKKLKIEAAADLKPLSPEDAQALSDMLAQMAAALKAVEPLEAIQELAAPRPHDLNWDLQLMAALARLAHPAIPVALIALFAAAPDKHRRKALKKALHRLQSRGVLVPDDLLPREEAAFSAMEAKPCTARVSGIDFHGDMVVVLEGPSTALGEKHLIALCNEKEGFKDLFLASIPRRQQDEVFAGLLGGKTDQWQEAPPAYALAILEDTFRRNPGAGESASLYRAMRERIRKYWGDPADAPDLERQLQLPAEAAARQKLLKQGSALASHNLFFPWLPIPAEVESWVAKVIEVEKSPLFLSQEQKEERLDQVMNQATAELYPYDSRGRWARRLRHMSHILYFRGETENAQIGWLAAQDLERDNWGPPEGENPFLKGLVTGIVFTAYSFTRTLEEETSPGGIITGGSDSLIIRP